MTQIKDDQEIDGETAAALVARYGTRYSEINFELSKKILSEGEIAELGPYWVSNKGYGVKLFGVETPIVLALNTDGENCDGEWVVEV